MSIGLEKKTYPFLLADAAIWPSSTAIVNCSLPGFTAADAAAFFFRHCEDLRAGLKAVIVYLGNCDAASSEARKGKYGRVRQLSQEINRIIGKAPVKTRIKNRLLHYEWNNFLDPRIEAPESPEDFEYNINRIIEACRHMSVPLILVRPRANLYFPPGVGKGNFLFYRYIGINERSANKISIPDARFKGALLQQESGKPEEAASIYKEILRQAPNVAMSSEYSLLVVNNYAVAKLEAGAVDEAKSLFQLLLKERGVRREIVLYNLAQIEKRHGNTVDYARLLEESYQADDSLYRIRAPYLEVLDRFSRKYPSIRVMDMHSVVSEDLYLDHCHPLPQGQAKMADAMSQYFREMGIQGRSVATIQNILYNPEFAHGNMDEFHQYYRTYAPFSEKQITEAVRSVRASIGEEGKYASTLPALMSAPKEIHVAFEYYLRHPCFPTIEDIFQFPPRVPSDVGRFPEYFIVRHLIPYLRLHESNAQLVRRFSAQSGLLRTSVQLTSILPINTIPHIDASYPQINEEYEESRLPRILAKVRQLLLQHLKGGNQVFERTKTTIYWYVRESLRFGAHSRISMRYDRVLMEFLAEGLAVAGVLDAAMGMKRAAELEQLISLLQRVVQIHEEYCGKFSMMEDSTRLLENYNAKLSEIASELEAASEEKCIS
ncbi:MAG: hypothetical protein WA056_07190 [Gallionella sp.]